MTAHIKAILFDLDDTLFDRTTAVERTLQAMSNEFPGLFSGITADKIIRAFFHSDEIATLEFNKGLSLEDTRLFRDREFLKSLGLDQGYAPAIDAFYVKYYPTNKVFVAGAKQIIERLARAYRLGLISNGNAIDQYQKLDNLGIRHLLNCTILSEEIGIRKPDPRIFQEASGLLKISVEECLYVGDSYDNDIIGARNAGMRACWFNPRDIPSPQTTVIPDFKISTLDQLTDILSRS
jgi:putative hydrolase of the HAD superfamily